VSESNRLSERYGWLQDGVSILGANLLFAGSFCCFGLWILASATLSTESMAKLPWLLLVNAIPIGFIGFTSGVIANIFNPKKRRSKILPVAVAFLGSLAGFFASIRIVSQVATPGTRNPGLPLPLEYADWIIFVMTSVGAVVVILLILAFVAINSFLARA